MKVLRIWLLVVLTALLPVRGALAAALMCPPAAMQGAAGMSHEMHSMHHEGMAHGEMHPHASDTGHGHHGAAQSGETPSPGHDKCNVCAASCSITPLLGSSFSMPQAPAPAAMRFPDLSSPVPSFLSDGQERPPRSI